METLDISIAEIMHDLRPEGAKFTVIVGELPIAACHGMWDSYAEAEEYASTVPDFAWVVPWYPR